MVFLFYNYLMVKYIEKGQTKPVNLANEGQMPDIYC